MRPHPCPYLSPQPNLYFIIRLESARESICLLPPEVPRRSYSRDKRPDCRQVVIAVVLSPEGFPLAYEIMPSNTSDKTTLQLFLQKIQAQYGQAKRIWVMDRGIPTEETLKEMRQSDPPVSYLVGTPRARWEQFKDSLEKVPWQKLRDTVEVKLLGHGDEVYVLAKSQGRRAKEIAIRRRKLTKLLRSLRTLRRTRQRPWKRDTLLHKLGAVHKEAGRAWRFVKITVPKARQPVSRDTFKFELLKDKIKDAQERDGHYLLRGFRAGDQAGTLWELYMQLTEIEAAFKTLKSDLHLRPTFLRVIDLKTRQVVAPLDFGKGARPHCAVLGPKNGLLYVTAELDNSVTAIDP